MLKLAPEALYTTSKNMQTRLKILLFYAFLLKYKILLLQTFSEFFLFVDRRTIIYVVGRYQKKTDFDSSSGHLQALLNNCTINPRYLAPNVAVNPHFVT